MRQYTNNHDELYHYGVLGMRWGVRRNRRMLKREASNDNPVAKAVLSKSAIAEKEAKNARSIVKIAKRHRTATKKEYQTIKKSAVTTKKEKNLAKKKYQSTKKIKQLAVTNYKIAKQKYIAEINAGKTMVSEFLKNNKN